MMNEDNAARRENIMINYIRRPRQHPFLSTFKDGPQSQDILVTWHKVFKIKC